MINHIDNLEQLKEERDRLNRKLEEEKMHLQDSVRGLKDEFNPVRQVVEVMSNAFVKKHNNGWLNVGVNMGIDFLAGKIFLRKAPFLIKLAVPFLLRNVASNYLYQHRGEIITKALLLVKKITEKRPEVLPVETEFSTKVRSLNADKPSIRQIS